MWPQSWTHSTCRCCKRPVPRPERAKEDVSPHGAASSAGRPPASTSAEPRSSLVSVAVEIPPIGHTAQMLSLDSAAVLGWVQLAATALLGIVVLYLNSGVERRKWLRDERAKAYSQFISDMDASWLELHRLMLAVRHDQGAEPIAAAKIRCKSADAQVMRSMSLVELMASEETASVATGWWEAEEDLSVPVFGRNDASKFADDLPAVGVFGEGSSLRLPSGPPSQPTVERPEHGRTSCQRSAVQSPTWRRTTLTPISELERPESEWTCCERRVDGSHDHYGRRGDEECARRCGMTPTGA